MERKLETLKRSDVPNEYLEAPNLRILYTLALQDWAIIIVCWWIALNSSAIWYPLLVLVIAGRIHALGVILHDLTHMNFKKKKLSLRGIEVIAGYPVGSTINAMAYHHLRHHRNTLLDNDPYYNYNKKSSALKKFFLAFKKGPLLVPFWIIRSFIGPFAYLFPRLRNFYARLFLQEVTAKDLSRNEEVRICCLEDFYQGVFHITLFLLALEFHSLFYLLYIPLFVAGIFCIYRLLVEHEYMIVENRSVYTIIECTSDHHLGLWGKIFFAPHKVGYHCMHHIHPSVGLHFLPKLRKWYMENSTSYREKHTGEEILKSQMI